MRGKSFAARGLPCTAPLPIWVVFGLLVFELIVICESTWGRDFLNDQNLNFLFDPKPQHYAGEIPIGSDMIHVSGGDRKDDFLDYPLAPPKP